MRAIFHAAALPLAALLSLPVQAADERESLEQLRATTLNLINALVETGAITRAKADELTRGARPQAAWGDAPGTAVAARNAASASVPATVRVPYVSETLRAQIRNEIRQEVLAQAKAERWVDPARMPDWVARLSPYGDLRVRHQGERFASDNTAPLDYDQSLQRASDLATRWASLADAGRSSGNTLDNTSTLRLRARLGVQAKLSNDTQIDVRIATGNNNSATSTNQTLDGNLGKYSLWLDRAFINTRLQPWAQLRAGRLANPFESSELVWDEDLNFDGLALRLQLPDPLGSGPYATLGMFPLQSAASPTRPGSSWLYGAQVGTNWDFSPRARLRASLALYDFNGIEGVKETDARLDPVLLTPSVTDYASTAYNAALRRKGNTLVRLNAPSDTSATVWGLASKFRPLHASLGLDLWHFTPTTLSLTLDYLRNTAFDRAEIAQRTGYSQTDGRADGWQARVVLGRSELRNPGDWSASLAYRLIGSDAMVDGFTDSDFGLGGTNQKGFVLGGTYVVDQRTTFGLKFINARSLATPSLRDASHRFSADVLQADLQVRF